MRMESARILRDATKLFGAQLCNGLVALLFSAWLIRTVTREELALYPILGLCTGFTASVSGFGLSMAQQRLIPERIAAGKEDEARAIARASLRITLSTALVLALTAAALAPQLSRWLLKSAEFTPTIRALTPAIFLGALANHFNYLLQSTNRFGRLSMNNLVTGSLGVMLAVPCYLVAGRKGLVVAMTVPQAVGCLLAFLHTRRFLFGSGRASSDLARSGRLIRYSLPFYGTSIVTFLNTNADSLLLAALTSPRYLATYYVAYRFVSYLFQFGNAGFRVLVVKVSQLQVQGPERVAASFTKASRYLFLFFIPACGVLAALAPVIIHLYAGEKYAGAPPILSLLCLYMFFFTLFGLHRFYIFNISAPVATLKLQVVTACLTLGFTAIAVHEWRGMGAAGGQALALMLASGVGYLMLRRDMPVRYGFGGIRVGAVALLPAAAILVVPRLFTPSIPVTVAAIAVSIPVFLAVLFRAVSPSDERLLREYLPAKAWKWVAALALIKAAPAEAAAESAPDTPTQSTPPPVIAATAPTPEGGN